MKRLLKRSRSKLTPSQRSRAVSPALKALFAHTGAGRSKVQRPFFGLSGREVDDLAAFVSARIGANISLKVERQ